MTQKKIKSLTDEQWKLVLAKREEWRAVGTCTAPADRPSAEDAVTKFYAFLNKPKPTFHWFDGPKTCRDEGSKLLGLTKDQVFGVREWGCEFAWWIARYAICRDILGVKFSAEADVKLRVWEQLCRSTGWFFPFDGVCLMSERNKSCSFDDRLLLHSATGPAIECRDGFKVFAWHGVRIPGKWIEDKAALTPKEALSVENTEQRRAACEILGWGKILEITPHRVIDKDVDPQIGELISLDLPGSPNTHLLRVMCGTGREFVLNVPSTTQTALEANAWTYDIDKDIFKQVEIRT